MTARAGARVLVALALEACAAPAVAPAAPARVDPPLALDPLTDLAPAAGLAWLLDAHPRAVLAAPGSAEAAAIALPTAPLDLLAKKGSNVDCARGGRARGGGVPGLDAVARAHAGGRRPRRARVRPGRVRGRGTRGGARRRARLGDGRRRSAPRWRSWDDTRWGWNKGISARCAWPCTSPRVDSGDRLRRCGPRRSRRRRGDSASRTRRFGLRAGPLLGRGGGRRSEGSSRAPKRSRVA